MKIPIWGRRWFMGLLKELQKPHKLLGFGFMVLVVVRWSLGYISTEEVVKIFVAVKTLMGI